MGIDGGVLAFTLGVLSPILATLGIYGVLANSVSQRTREFGMRQALGTRFGQLIALMLAGSFGL